MEKNFFLNIKNILHVKFLFSLLRSGVHTQWDHASHQPPSKIISVPMMTIYFPPHTAPSPPPWTSCRATAAPLLPPPCAISSPFCSQA